jgi:uncharacterized protein
MESTPTPHQTPGPITLGTRLRYGGIFLLSVIGFIVTQVLAETVARLFFHPRSHELAYNMISRPLGLVFMLLLFGVMARFLNKDAGGLLASQGLGFASSWRRDFLVGSFLGAAMIVLSVLALSAFGGYRAELFLNAPMVVRLLCILWMGLTAAALEEVAFRGYPFQMLIGAIGPWGATLMFALLFGFIHLWNPSPSAIGFANTALVSILLALAFLRTGYLWFPIGLHFAWNFTLGTVFGLPVSGVNIFAAVVKGHAQGPLLLTGGDYGIEASLTGTVVIILGLAVISLVTPSKKVSSGGTQAGV